MSKKILAPSCARTLRALADETRLAVINELLVESKNVNQINKNLPVSQSLLSHHLKILRDAGLVVGRRVGKSVRYELAPSVKLDQADKGIDLGWCKIAITFRDD